MGKGGGCVPSKKKGPLVAQDSPPEATQGFREAVIETEQPNTHPDEPTRVASSLSAAVGSTKLKIFIVFYSMYGHVEGLAKSLKKGVDIVDGVEGVLYRVPEILSDEVLSQMKAPPKDETVPEITAAELTAADGVLFGFPTRYGAMAAQMKAFFDSTGQLWKEQKLAGKPAGFFVSTGTQGGGQETTA